jgi:hypothetical protein
MSLSILANEKQPFQGGWIRGKTVLSKKILPCHKGLNKAAFGMSGKLLQVSTALWHSGRRVPRRLLHDTRRYAGGSGSVRHVDQDDRHGSDFAVVPNPHAAKNLSIGTELDVVADSRHWTVAMTITYCQSLPHCAIGTYRRIGMNKDVAKMPNTQAWAYVRSYG